jgi:hypothetical protein
MLVNEAQLIAYAAIFLAVFLRTTMPYWKKKRTVESKGEELPFDGTYIGTAISAGIISFVGATLLFRSFVMPTTGDLLSVFVSAFGFGWTSNDIINDYIGSVTPPAEEAPTT